MFWGDFWYHTVILGFVVITFYLWLFIFFPIKLCNWVTPVFFKCPNKQIKKNKNVGPLQYSQTLSCFTACMHRLIFFLLLLRDAFFTPLNLSVGITASYSGALEKLNWVFLMLEKVTQMQWRAETVIQGTLYICNNLKGYISLKIRAINGYLNTKWCDSCGNMIVEWIFRYEVIWLSCVLKLLLGIVSLLRLMILSVSFLTNIKLNVCSNMVR